MKTAIEPKTWPEAETLMSQFAETQVEITKIKALWEESLLSVARDYGKRVKSYEEKRADLEKALKKFAAGHKAEFKPMPIGDGRSYEHAGVTLGFRRTPPAVRIEDEETAVTYLCQYYKDEYVHTQFAPNREALKSALQNGNERLVEALAAHGITLKQVDKFFVEMLAK